ncbi:AAA family ATPase [Psychrobacter sp. I-STPA10]|uniref:AAA family ATPase n=1 Tax=Psychrobacter sp. I-STPA10 TaxID=2585769 RepID=UPI001E616365|nr:AAA family ATPase [Psychrobacter sp. I-STPA10]
MKFSLRNIRPLNKGDIELNKLTILCGENNTGKTYITNTIYSFLGTWEEHIQWKIPGLVIDDLHKNGAIKVDLNELIISNISDIRESISSGFAEKLSEYLACSDNILENMKFDFDFDMSEEWIKRDFKSGIRNSIDGEFLTVKKVKNSHHAEILLKKTSDRNFPEFLLQDILTKILVQCVITDIPRTFIASAERTGAAIFKNELNFRRNQLINYLGEMSSSNSTRIDPFELVSKFKGNYAYSVERNVDFISDLNAIESKGESEFIKENNFLIKDFIKISGGQYKSSENGAIYFYPENTDEGIELKMGESSSTVRALMLIWYWLNYIAQKDSLLIIDEPELNLHPANQRKFARFLVNLVNSGVKVFITTHSDYIIREINTLILMSNLSDNTKLIKEKYGYRNDEQLKIDDVSIYIAEKSKTTEYNNINLEKIDVTMDEGIVIRSFDEEIKKLNQIQDGLMFGFD